MLSRYTYFRTKGSGGFRSIFSDQSQPTLYFLDVLLHNSHDTSSPQYISPTIHHPHHTSPPRYIIPTIHHPHHTSSPPYILPPYTIPTIHRPHHTYSLSCIIPNHTPSFSTVHANVHHGAWSGISGEPPQWESDVWDLFCDILNQNRPRSPQDEDMLLRDSN